MDRTERDKIAERYASDVCGYFDFRTYEYDGQSPMEYIKIRDAISNAITAFVNLNRTSLGGRR